MTTPVRVKTGRDVAAAAALLVLLFWLVVHMVKALRKGGPNQNVGSGLFFGTIGLHEKKNGVLPRDARERGPWVVVAVRTCSTNEVTTEANILVTPLRERVHTQKSEQRNTRHTHTHTQEEDDDHAPRRNKAGHETNKTHGPPWSSLWHHHRCRCGIIFIIILIVVQRKVILLVPRRLCRRIRCVVEKRGPWATWFAREVGKNMELG